MVGYRGDDTTIRIWDVKENNQVALLGDHTQRVNSVVFSPNDTNRLVSGSGDRTVRIWDVDTEEALDILRSHESSVNTVAYSPDGEFLASGSTDNFIGIWKMEITSEELGTLQADGEVNALSLSGDGTLLAVVSDNNTIEIWDRKTAEIIRYTNEREEEGIRIAALAFNPQDRMQLAVGTDKEFFIYDLNDRSRKTLKRQSVNAVAFSHDGTYLAAEVEGYIQIWHRDQHDRPWKMNKTELKCKFDVNSLAFDPTGETRLALAEGNTIRLWDFETGEKPTILRGHDGEVLSVAFSTDGKRLASGSDDNTVRLWDTEKLEEISTLSGHTERVKSVAFSPDGKRLASGSDDKTIRLWDLVHIEILPMSWKLGKHGASVNAVVFSNDGDYLVSGGADSKIRIWETRPSAEVAKERREAEAVAP